MIQGSAAFDNLCMHATFNCRQIYRVFRALMARQLQTPIFASDFVQPTCVRLLEQHRVLDQAVWGEYIKSQGIYVMSSSRLPGYALCLCAVEAAISLESDSATLAGRVKTV